MTPTYDCIAPGGFRHPFITLVLLVGLLALTGCTSSRGGTIPYDVADFGRPDAPSQQTIDTDYRIAPLDKVRVSVFQLPDLSGEYQVDLLGNVALPLIGNVRAVDKTPTELQVALTQRYSDKLLKNPDITVGILEAGGSRITVDGSVKSPGMFSIMGKTSLLQVIALAKGLEDDANEKRVAIFRQIDGQRMAAAFDLSTIRAGTDQDPQVYPGDIIVVDGSKSRQAFRDVLSSIPIFGIFRPLAY